MRELDDKEVESREGESSKREREEKGERERRGLLATFPRYMYAACDVSSTPCTPTNMSIVSSTIFRKDVRVCWKNVSGLL